MDLEYVGVYVCPADLGRSGGASRAAGGRATEDVRAAIRRVQYSQHGARDEMDCDVGECPFEDGAKSASKLVAYSGLFSHALYPRASILWVRCSLLYRSKYGAAASKYGVGFFGNGAAFSGAVFIPHRDHTSHLEGVRRLHAAWGVTICRIVLPFSWGCRVGV